VKKREKEGKIAKNCKISQDIERFGAKKESYEHFLRTSLRVWSKPRLKTPDARQVIVVFRLLTVYRREKQGIRGEEKLSMVRQAHHKWFASSTRRTHSLQAFRQAQGKQAHHPLRRRKK